MKIEIEPFAIILHDRLNFCSGLVDANRDFCSSRMFADIRQTLLHQTVDGVVEFGRERTIDRQVVGGCDPSGALKLTDETLDRFY